MGMFETGEWEKGWIGCNRAAVGTVFCFFVIGRVRRKGCRFLAAGWRKGCRSLAEVRRRCVFKCAAMLLCWYRFQKGCLCLALFSRPPSACVAVVASIAKSATRYARRNPRSRAGCHCRVSASACPSQGLSTPTAPARRFPRGCRGCP